VSGTRAHPRYALEIDAEIVTAQERIPARTRNISHGGLSVEATQNVLTGDIITIFVALVFDDERMSESLALKGRVVWCTPLAPGRFQIGATFVNLTREDRSYIELFLRYLDDA